jgi:hypothetical protein
MGWIRWTGKTLEFVGKLAQADSFERWAESQGEKIISDLALKSGGIVFGLGKESKAKGILWSDLETIAEKSPSLNAAIQDVVGQYPSILSTLRSNYSLLPHESVYLIVVPRHLVNRLALADVTKNLDGSQELAQLKGGPVFRQYFLEELVNQIDHVFTHQAGKTSPDKPLEIGDDDWLVGFDENYQWEGTAGHYFVYSSYSHTRQSADKKAKKEGRMEAGELLEKCQVWLGKLSPAERQKLESKFPR